MQGATVSDSGGLMNALANVQLDPTIILEAGDYYIFSSFMFVYLFASSNVYFH